ncbi:MULTISPECIES: hypothetical protein [Hyphomicrobiales]|jgi:hypothetical protein|uniref:Uncharacterized protein n=3 Tax=Hyphomicrobiales TaxID=356 RepID=A0A7W5Z4U2_9HYPH|nr:MULTISPECIES: hypothetical protein [Hyphomicrobiales]MBB3810203.1 hypothetical protein [Pseudochelatococcus contaminans]MBB5274740.1 hypothetical protein [Rhizobium rosettiformans]THV34129.1 hypothetical protein FAA86_16895 [Rhizobium rosettiformans W3]
MTPVVAPHRTLEQAFLDALEELANDSTGSWWRDVLQHPDLVLAVRRNSINAYHRGASIFRIDWKAGQVIPFTHAKYLVKPAQTYVALERGEFQFDARDLLQQTYLGMETLNDMCRAASRYAGMEKAGLHPMLVGNPDVIDVEIALTRLSSPGDDGDEEVVSSDRTQDRIDAAIAMTDKNGVPTVRFYEAKHFTNSALRASGDNFPDVVRQIADYEKALKAYQAQLSAGYLETAKALIRFNEMRAQAFGDNSVRSLAPVIHQIAETGQAPVVDTLPHLIIYGFDRAQRDDDTWQVHLGKVEKVLSRSRVRAIGNPTRATVFNR